VHSFAQNLNKLETFKSNVFVKFRMWLLSSLWSQIQNFGKNQTISGKYGWCIYAILNFKITLFILKL
jgi:hypothetical protein